MPWSLCHLQYLAQWPAFDLYRDEHRALAALLEPAIVAFATLYVMISGYLLLTGKIEEPFVTGSSALSPSRSS